jgi:hypothetical protein
LQFTPATPATGSDIKSNTTATSNIKPSPKVLNSNSNSYRKNPLSTDICTILHNDDLKTEEEEEIFVAEIVNIDDDDQDEDLESGSSKADDKNNVSGGPGSLSVMDSAVPTTALRPTSNSIPTSPLIRPVSTSLLTSLLLRPATAGPSTSVMFTPPQSFAVFKDRQAGLWIRIHFIRIRIQHFRLNTDPDPGL